MSTATGLAPNKVKIGRLPRFPPTVFDRTGLVGHQRLARDHLAYCDFATDRQKRANDFFRAHHALTLSRVNRKNSYLVEALRPAPYFAVGGVQRCLHHPLGCESDHGRQGAHVETRA